MELKDLYIVKEGQAAMIELDNDPINGKSTKQTLVYYNHPEHEWIVTDFHTISPILWMLRLKTRTHLEFGSNVLGKRVHFRINLKQCTLGKVFYISEKEMFLNHWLK